jgi:hypothetical protein
MRIQTVHRPAATAVAFSTKVGNAVRYLRIIAVPGAASILTYQATNVAIVAYWPESLEPADLLVRLCAPVAVLALTVARVSLQASGQPGRALWQSIRHYGGAIGWGAVMLWLALLIAANPANDQQEKIVLLIVALSLALAFGAILIAWRAVRQLS